MVIYLVTQQKNVQSTKSPEKEMVKIKKILNIFILDYNVAKVL